MFGELTNADGGIIVLLLTFFFRKFDLQNLYLIFFYLVIKKHEIMTVIGRIDGARSCQVK